ncbi:hypothetical protein V1477_011657 [Vespula maculifrons]|uniref:Uncharacterized protein n=1 Tax=Vespula maculifrons TaxID=7453 RepID=A0ABD2BZU0_VESMC
MDIECSYTRPKPEYENRARFFDTERRKPAQKPTPTSPTHRSHPKEIRIMDLEYLFPSIGKIFWKNLKERSHSQGDTCSLQDFDISQVLPTQVPPRGGCCIWGPSG